MKIIGASALAAAVLLPFAAQAQDADTTVAAGASVEARAEAPGTDISASASDLTIVAKDNGMAKADAAKAEGSVTTEVPASTAHTAHDHAAMAGAKVEMDAKAEKPEAAANAKADVAGK